MVHSNSCWRSYDTEALNIEKNPIQESDIESVAAFSVNNKFQSRYLKAGQQALTEAEEAASTNWRKSKNAQPNLASYMAKAPGASLQAGAASSRLPKHLRGHR